MGAYNVAVATPEGTDVPAAIEVAMGPHRYEQFDWYAIGGYDWPQIAAYVDPEGRWNEGPAPDGVPTVIVRCKG